MVARAPHIRAFRYSERMTRGLMAVRAHLTNASDTECMYVVWQPVIAISNLLKYYQSVIVLLQLVVTKCHRSTQGALA